MGGKFSKDQVKKMMEEWGRDDTSEDDEDYYYDGILDSSVDNEGNAYFEQSLHKVHHHLQYTISQSPGKSSVVEEPPLYCATAMATATTSEKSDDFYYQYHTERKN